MLFLSANLLPETESSRDEFVCLGGGDVGVHICAPGCLNVKENSPCIFCLFLKAHCFVVCIIIHI